MSQPPKLPPIVLLYTSQASKRVFLKKTLTKDYHIIEARNALEIREKLDTTSISLVILDDKDTDIPIESILKEIRSNESRKDLPILVMTANLKKTYMKKILTCGASDFLREPLDEDEVYNRISSAVKAQSIKERVNPFAKKIASTFGLSKGKDLSSLKVSLKDQVIRLIQSALKSKESLSLLVLNVDHVEKVRHRWGEQALEELLTGVEKHLKSLKREQDLITEATNNRLVIILPKTSETAAKIIAEDFKDSFKKNKFSTHKGSVKLTVSIGLTSLSNEKLDQTALEHLDMMLKAGENCLRKAKHIGNRIVSS